MKAFFKFLAGLLATCCITTIVGLVPTMFWHVFFDYVLIEGLEVGEFVMFGHTNDGFMLFESITVRTTLTFVIVAFIIYVLQDYWAPHTTTIILAWCFPVLVNFEILLFESVPDGLLFKWLYEWMHQEPLHRAAWLWTLALWLESIVVELRYKAFDQKHWREELWLNWVTSSGVSAIYFIILSTLDLHPFSRNAYVLLPVMSLHQFALAKRKSVKATKSKKAPAAPTDSSSSS